MSTEVFTGDGSRRAAQELNDQALRRDLRRESPLAQIENPTDLEQLALDGALSEFVIPREYAFVREGDIIDFPEPIHVGLSTQVAAEPYVSLERLIKRSKGFYTVIYIGTAESIEYRELGLRGKKKRGSSSVMKFVILQKDVGSERQNNFVAFYNPYI